MNSTVTELSNVLRQQLENGSSARASFGGKTIPFSWCGDRIVNSTISKVSSVIADSTHVRVASVSYDSDVSAWTSGAKPETASISEHAETLKVFPGVVSATTTQIIDGANLMTAINEALYGQALHALDKDLVSNLVLTGDQLAKAADLSSIAEAQAMLLGHGFSPDIVVLSPSVYASLMGASSGFLTGGNDARESQLSVLGSTVTVSSVLTGASAVVLDSTAVVAFEHEASPVAIVDSHAKTNSTDIVVELVAGSYVARPMGVVSISTT